MPLTGDHSTVVTSTQITTELHIYLHRIPWVFHVQRNPRVFMVCGYPV